MDGQEYLDQISASNKPIKTSKISKILSSKYFIFGAIAVIILIVVLIIGSILANSKADTKSLSYALKLHIENTSKIISDYQPEVKSSTLRSYSASLSSILSDTNNKLNTFLTETYGNKTSDISKKISDQATLEKDNLEAELFQAKITGTLDRIFAHKMTYEISMISAEETKIYNTTGNEELKSLLSTSYNSLLNLYDSFNNFSETK